MPQNYDTIFIEFKNACDLTPKKVFLTGRVLDDAEKYYKLKTKRQLLEFIANDGLHELGFVNKTEWRDNFTPNKPLYVYAYHFRTNAIPGYIGIIKNELHGNWFIKSIHPPKDSVATLAGPLLALGIKSSED